MKIWLLTNMPSFHQIEFFNAIGNSRKTSLSVRFTYPDYRGVVWKPEKTPPFDYQTLRGVGPRTETACFRICPRAIWEVLFGRYDFYILSGGYVDLTFLICAFLLWLCRKHWAIWGEAPWPAHWRATWIEYRTARSPLAGKLRYMLVSVLMRMAPRVFCVGTVAIQEYHKYGARKDKLVLLPYTCDVERYQTVDPTAVERIRGELDLEGKIVYLFSGRMTHGKGVDLLLEAFHELAKQRPDVALLLLGDGPERQEYEESIDETIRDRVHFFGHCSQADLPVYFNAADVFTFPSRYDGWGLVVNEACGAALPIISTKRVGASYDLVVEGKNGFVIPVDDAKALLERMRFFADNKERIREFGARSLDLIASLTPEKGVDLLLQGIRGESPAQHSATTNGSAKP